MIMINDEWENPKDMNDIVRIVRDGFSGDLAYLIDTIVSDMILDYDSELITRDNEIDDLENTIADLEYKVIDLEEQITDLERERDDLLDQLYGER